MVLKQNISQETSRVAKIQEKMLQSTCLKATKRAKAKVQDIQITKAKQSRKVTAENRCSIIVEIYLCIQQ